MTKTLKRIFTITITLCFSLLIVFWLLVIPIGNEIILSGYEKDLKNYDIGCEYDIIETAKSCGKLYDNGNGMEYLVVSIIKTDENVNENLPTIGDGIFIIRADNNEKLDELLNVNGSIDKIKEKLSNISDQSKYYILYSLHSADNEIWDLDFRAH